MRRELLPEPPPGLTPVDPRTWSHMWARVMASPSVKCVGFACAYFADYKHGHDVRPGIPLLMRVCGGMSNKTVGDALKLMREWGVLWRYYEAAKSGIKGDVDMYQLVFPDDITAIPMMCPKLHRPEECTCG